MSITDELREWGKKLYTTNSASLKNELERIADRIDAEHQKAEDEWKAENGQAWINGYAECRAELMEGDKAVAADLEKAGWVRGPLDADGEPWHIGDEIANEHNYHLTVSEITYKSNGCWMLHAEPNWSFYANIARHHHPPTVEDVLREMIDELFVDVYADPDTIAEYAKRLRLAGEGE